MRGTIWSRFQTQAIDVIRALRKFTGRTPYLFSSVSLVIANHLSGPRISRRRFAFNRRQQELDRWARPLQRR
jgi:hypothetical protein